MKKVLFIGMVWPESNSTAAGGRMISLLKLFLSEGFSVHFACAAALSDRSDDLETLGCSSHDITLNSDGFNAFIQGINPEVVVYDRFIMEEQYGWRVADACPNACRVLDTEDLHFLRDARAHSVKKYGNLSEVNLYTKTAKREIASILRCDLSLIISEAESELLQDTFHIPRGILVYHPITFDEITESDSAKFPAFKQRSGFMTIGNFKHAPNLDAVKYTRDYVWPEVKKLMPEAEMNVYGAYLDDNDQSWAKSPDGFHIHGAATSADEAFRAARVCLAPLRFGAGLKGKLLRAALNGTPSVTTRIGAEGIAAELEWPGAMVESPELLAKKAVDLYTSESLWNSAVKTGIQLVNTRFSRVKHEQVLMHSLRFKLAHLEEERKKYFISSILQFHTLRSTEFMSRWIAEKNRDKKN
ncbi:MAG: glycosyltransferase [Flavobacteriales bacterium]